MMPTAAILAGGLATRLQQVTTETPKCLVHVSGAPFLYHQFTQLRRFGVENVVLLVGHLNEQVRAYAGDGSAYGLSIQYSVEEIPLGTAGAVKLAEELLSEPFFVLNGDTLADVDLSELYARHLQNPDAAATLALCEMDDIADYGSVEVDKDHRITCFAEKRFEHIGGLVNAGIYCCSKELLDWIPAGRKVSIETEVFPPLLETGRLQGMPFRGEFVDIGTPERLDSAQAHRLFAGEGA